MTLKSFMRVPLVVDEETVDVASGFFIHGLTLLAFSFMA
jgi:hypothetical protein